MTVFVSLRTEPETRKLAVPFDNVTVTVKRLRTPEWEAAREAAQAIVRDDAKLWPLLVEHDLLPKGGLKALKRQRETDPLEYLAALSGIVVWLTSVECALAGLLSWEGIKDQATGKDMPVTREVLEALLLDDRMSGQLMAILTDVARLLVIEGKPSGA